MLKGLFTKRSVAMALLAVLALASTIGGNLLAQQKEQKPQMRDGGTSREESAKRSQNRLVKEVRHELLTLPYYSVFDWIEYEVRPDATVILRGQVTSPPDTKSAAEASVKEIEGVARVVNEIEVLPVSPNDERLRLALYSAIFNQGSPLFRYALGAVPSIHIIVKNGRATLKGVVATQMDKQLAYTRARGVPGLFEVTNELMVEDKKAK